MYENDVYKGSLDGPSSSVQSIKLCKLFNYYMGRQTDIICKYLSIFLQHIYEYDEKYAYAQFRSIHHIYMYIWARWVFTSMQWTIWELWEYSRIYLIYFICVQRNFAARTTKTRDVSMPRRLEKINLTWCVSVCEYKVFRICFL